MANYSRPASGFRFKNEGMNTAFPPDALPEFKYPYLQNIRSYLASTMQSRPGIFIATATPGAPFNLPITALEPTIGVYKIGGSVFHNAVAVAAGFAAGFGCSIIPYRPNASPNAYDYVFDDNKSIKVSNPSSGVIFNKVGIAEPQIPPDVCPQCFAISNLSSSFSGAAANWTAAGTAGALADATRSTEVVGAIFGDPFGGANNRLSVQVATASSYSIWELIKDNTSGNFTTIIDVIAPFNLMTSTTVGAIFYFSGNTGRCIVVPSFGSAFGPGVPTITKGIPSQESLYAEELLATLRRGAIIKIGTETVLVLSVAKGPNNQISIETSTVNNHVAGEQIVGIPTIVLANGFNWVAGHTALSSQINSSVTAGIGNITNNGGIGPLANPFTTQLIGPGNTIGPIPQQDDYFHISIQVDNLTNLNEIKLLFDVGDGSFTQNYYYITIRPSDLQPAIANTSTQLAAAQLVAQRALLDAESALAVGNQLKTFSSLLTSDGTSQWTEVIFPLSSLTKVGNNDAATLANLQNFRIVVNANATVNIGFWGIYVGGGGATDVGNTASPYFYRLRPRSSVTGVIGNPSPSTRYGVSSRRQANNVSIPASSDPQIDTMDVFRLGGSITTWRYVGSISSSTTPFLDNFSDDAVADAQILDESQFEPFPSIGPPITASSATIVGTTMVATFPTAAASPAGAGTLSQLQNLLPGNLFNIGGLGSGPGAQIYTLRVRPTLVSQVGGTQTWFFEFIENAGAQTNPLVLCQEPNLANQGAKAVFGPDSNGSLFAIQAGAANNGGVGLRPGLVQWTNPNNPDGASDANTSDICAPSEPLLNGMVVSDTPIVLSAAHAWRGFSGQDANGNLTYNFRGIPVSRGLAAQFGIASDGAYIYYVAEDSIRRTSGGADESITDDLYNIFPHEGIQGKNVVYANQTVFAPSYQFAQNFRLAVINSYLYFDYLDGTQTQRTLVCDLRTMAWTVDVYVQPISIHATTTLPPSNNLIPANAVLNQELFLGDILGNIYNESPTAAENVACVVVTREEVVGDIRANKMFGDAAIDMIPAGGNVTVTPVFLSALFATNTVIAGGQVLRPVSPPQINLLGEQLKRTMGLSISWTDNAVQSTLFMWQISYLTQPEDITNRIGDWDNAGVDGAKFFQGFLLESDTLNAPKSISIRGGDDLAIKQTFVVTANGQQQQVFSFTNPFIAHLVRYEPDSAIWRMFGIQWIYQPTPEAALNWITQPTGHSIEGFKHVPFINFAYNAPAPVTLAITGDGVMVTVVLPATTGYQKVPVRIPPNKGQVYQYSATSTQPFQVWNDDIEILVGQWGRSTPLKTAKVIGSTMGAQATV